MEAHRRKDIAHKALSPELRRDIGHKQRIARQCSGRAFHDQRPPLCPSPIDMFPEPCLRPVFIILRNEVPETPARECGKETFRVLHRPHAGMFRGRHKGQPLALTPTDEALPIIDPKSWTTG